MSELAWGATDFSFPTFVASVAYVGILILAVLFNSLLKPKEIELMRKFLILLCLAGCAKVQEGKDVNIDRNVTVVIDLSSSFAEEMFIDRFVTNEAEGTYIDTVGKTFKFLLSVLSKLDFEDRITLCQISADENAVLWEGNLVQIRRDFPDPIAFYKFLKTKSNPDGTLLYDALNRSIKQSLSHDGKRSIFVLSDMLDTDPNGAAKIPELRSLLEEYAKSGGMIGFFYVNQDLVPSGKPN